MTESSIEERLFEEFGKNLDLVEILPSNGGMSNPVWILHGKKRKYVLRLGKEKALWRIKKESVLLQSLRGSMPVPQVLEYKPSSQTFPCGYLLIEYCAGSIASSSPENLQNSFFEQAAHTLGFLHCKKYEDFGFLLDRETIDADPTIVHSNPGPFGNAFEQIFSQVEGWYRHLEQHGSRYSPLLRTFLRRMYKYEPRFQHQKACFIHDDFSLKNLLEENSKLTGVIDFELAKAGDPCSDLHYFLQIPFDKGCPKKRIQRFIECYSREYGLPVGFQEKQNFMRYYYGFRKVITLKPWLERIPEEEHEQIKEKLRKGLVALVDRTDLYLINDGI